MPAELQEREQSAVVVEAVVENFVIRNDECAIDWQRQAPQQQEQQQQERQPCHYSLRDNGYYDRLSEPTLRILHELVESSSSSTSSLPSSSSLLKRTRRAPPQRQRGYLLPVVTRRPQLVRSDRYSWLCGGTTAGCGGGDDASDRRQVRSHSISCVLPPPCNDDNNNKSPQQAQPYWRPLRGGGTSRKEKFHDIELMGMIQALSQHLKFCESSLSNQHDNNNTLDNQCLSDEQEKRALGSTNDQVDLQKDNMDDYTNPEHEHEHDDESKQDASSTLDPHDLLVYPELEHEQHNTHHPVKSQSCCCDNEGKVIEQQEPLSKLEEMSVTASYTTREEDIAVVVTSVDDFYSTTANNHTHSPERNDSSSCSLRRRSWIAAHTGDYDEPSTITENSNRHDTHKCSSNNNNYQPNSDDSRKKRKKSKTSQNRSIVPPLEFLPDIPLATIVSYLDCASLSFLSATCRTIRDACNNEWEHRDRELTESVLLVGCSNRPTARERVIAYAVGVEDCERFRAAPGSFCLDTTVYSNPDNYDFFAQFTVAQPATTSRRNSKLSRRRHRQQPQQQVELQHQCAAAASVESTMTPLHIRTSAASSTEQQVDYHDDDCNKNRYNYNNDPVDETAVLWQGFLPAGSIFVPRSLQTIPKANILLQTVQFMTGRLHFDMRAIGAGLWWDVFEQDEQEHEGEIRTRTTASRTTEPMASLHTGTLFHPPQHEQRQQQRRPDDITNDDRAMQDLEEHQQHTTLRQIQYGRLMHVLHQCTVTVIAMEKDQGYPQTLARTVAVICTALHDRKCADGPSQSIVRYGMIHDSQKREADDVSEYASGGGTSASWQTEGEEKAGLVLYIDMAATASTSEDDDEDLSTFPSKGGLNRALLMMSLYNDTTDGSDSVVSMGRRSSVASGVDDPLYFYPFHSQVLELSESDFSL